MDPLRLAGAALAATLLLSASAPASPVAHLRFDEGSGAQTSDAGNRMARLVDGPRWTEGLVANALHFAGAGQRVLVPHRRSLDLGRRFTLAAWVRPGRRGSQTILAKARHGEIDGYALQLSSRGTLFVRFNQATRRNDLRVSSRAPYPADGRVWMHVAASYDGREIRLYLDGTLERRKPTSSLAVAANTLDLSIGAHPDGSQPLEGTVDDVRVYDRALSAAELRSLVASSRPPDRDGDAVADASDAFPDDPFEWSDQDGDGLGDEADLDDDGDGLPDGWEIANGFDPADPGDALADADRDGVPNAEEFRRRGNPRDAPPAAYSPARGTPLPGLESWSLRPLAARATRGGTGEKPQSKVWTHDGRWFAVFSDPRGTWIWRRDADQWSRVLELASGVSARADYALEGDGAVVHVLLHSDVAPTRLASAEYVPGHPGSYRPWRRRPRPVALPFRSPPETATLALDTRGRLWVAYDTPDSVRVRHSDRASAYAVWSEASTLGFGIHDDDIAAIVAFADRLGVMWSNTRTKRFAFRSRGDADPPGVWSAEEAPGIGSAAPVGGGFADDHLNLAVGSDGTLYAAVKTSFDTPELPMIGLLVRRPSGLWSRLQTVDGHGTRPIAVLNEKLGQILVIYSSDDEGGRIVYRVSDLKSFAFGERQTLLRDHSVNDASSTKQRFEGELVVIAATRGASPQLLSVVLEPFPAPR